MPYYKTTLFLYCTGFDGTHIHPSYTALLQRALAVDC